LHWHDEMSLLERFDTPTICNALELIDSSRRDFGFTRHNMFAVNATPRPVVGFAFTATMRSHRPSSLSKEALKLERMKYYEHVYEPTDVPKICVMQDLDDGESPRGPFWGEFNTRIHRSMGFRAVVTNGCVRDVDNLPDDVLLLCEGLRPSHANVHITSYGEPVTVFGMQVSEGDIVHADRHGAVTFPSALSQEVVLKAAEHMAGEEPVIRACLKDEMTLDDLRRLYLARG
jgi:regulator of RNase E activity RraA